VSCTRVIGPPGTGKTTYLARQVERAVDKFGPDRVLVCSLTKTAAHEIASRGLSVARQHVGTLHALAYRALGRPKMFNETDFATDSGYRLTPASLSGDELEVMASGDDDKVRAQIDLLRMRGVDEALWPENILPMWEAMKSHKQATGTVDFSDMIQRALDELPAHPDNPRAIFYDEAQDGSALELALIRQWGAHCEHVIVVGDDMQVLYAWRGASVRGFLEFGDNQIVLPTTWRLSRSVWQYAMRWRDQVKVKANAPFKPREDAPEGSVERIAATVGGPHAILRYVDENPDREVMVLATCGYMLRPLVKLLRQKSIPFHNPHRVRQGAWNPLARGKTSVRPADRVIAFCQVSEEVMGEGMRPWTWKELHAWVDVLNATAIERGGKTEISRKAKEIGDEIVGYGDLERLVGVRGVEEAEAGNFQWFSENTLKSKTESLDFPIRVAENRGIQALIQPPRVVVGTCHSVKGAESMDVVLFPDLSPPAYRAYFGSDMDARDGVLRTLYVGITRAKERLFLAQGTGSSAKWLELLE